MKESLRNEILAAYYGSLAQYEKVGIEIRRFFDAALDPSVPADAIYTIKQRLKALKIDSSKGSRSERTAT